MAYIAVTAIPLNSIIPIHLTPTANFTAARETVEEASNAFKNQVQQSAFLDWCGRVVNPFIYPFSATDCLTNVGPECAATCDGEPMGLKRDMFSMTAPDHVAPE